MLSNFTFLLLLAALLTAPGFCVVLYIKQRYKSIHAQPLLTISISYAIFIFSLLSFRSFGITATVFSYWILSYLVISCLLLGFVFIRSVRNSQIPEGIHKNFLTHPFFIIAAVMLMYQFYAGAYLEIPADIYQHLGLYQATLTLQGKNKLGRALDFIQIFQQKSWAWYHFMGLLTRFSDISIEALLFVSTWITKTCFLIAVFYLAHFIFKKEQINDNVHNESIILVAFATCIFTFFHFGVNVFAFTQYYAFAPAIMAQVGYFTCVALFIVFFKKPTSKTGFFALMLAGVLTLAINTVHQQEAMFIIIIFSLMLLMSNLPVVVDKYSFKEKRLLRLSLFLLMIAAISIYVFAHLYLERSDNIGWRLWEFSEGYGLIPKISTLNMKYQGIQVITLWGLFVYLLFFIHLKRYKHNLFILAGMFSPFFTVLNPFFTDLFLRLDHSSTLFRLCYMIPLHFVAADIFIHYVSLLRAHHKKKQTLMMKPVLVICLFLFVALLLPIKNTWNNIHYSRFPTLLAVDSGNSPKHLDDLIQFLSTIEKRKKILTDPTTGYVISGLTRHHSWRGKFHETKNYRKFTFDDYDDNPLSKYKGYLLIVNKRTNKLSTTGKLSGHWDQFQLSSIKQYYPDQLLKHLENFDDKFQSLWKNNSISVYLIK